MLQARHYNQVTSRVLLALFVIMVFLAPASAIARASTSLTQGYNVKEPIATGSIVGLEKNSRDTVVASTAQTADTILGVVVEDNSSPLTIRDSPDQVQVATSGAVSVLASDINGEIEQGDQITSSLVKGVGMKATRNTKVIGVAQGPLSSTGKQTITDEFGKKREITVGQVPVVVSVSYHYQEPEKTVIPQALQNIANTVAGKQVDAMPIIISAVIFIVTLITVTSIIYAMIRSSIISVGRNPMAQSAVYRGLIQLSVLVLAVIGVAITVIYLILTRL